MSDDQTIDVPSGRYDAQRPPPFPVDARVDVYNPADDVWDQHGRMLVDDGTDDIVTVLIDGDESPTRTYAHNVRLTP